MSAKVDRLCQRLNGAHLRAELLQADLDRMTRDYASTTEAMTSVVQELREQVEKLEADYGRAMQVVAEQQERIAEATAAVLCAVELTEPEPAVVVEEE